MIKKYYLSIILISFHILSYAQVAINTAGTAPNTSAMLDITAANKGLLIPRVALQNKTDATSIVAPAPYLLVYNTNIILGTGLYVNAGTAVTPSWINIGNGTGSWSLGGNSGTDLSNYIGTNDLQPLRFRVNNIPAGIIDPTFANTAIGISTLRNITTGRFNTAVGDSALYSNIIGSSNSAYGYYSLNANTTGFSNTANGQKSLYFNTSGNNNTANGDSVLYSNISGSSNTANGARSLYSNTTGTLNTASGANALYFNTTGGSNTAFGNNTLFTNSIGTRNTAIGQGADVGVNNLTNASAIGASAIVASSNNMVFGDVNVVGWGFGTAASAGVAIRVGTSNINGNGAFLTGGGTWTNISDKNLKDDISIPENILYHISRLPITRWRYKGGSEYHIGPMAQDFYKEFKVGVNDKSISTIDPAGVALLGIQELQKKDEALQKEVEMLKTTLSQMQEKIKLLEKNK